jgi:hypothetical protein
LSHFTLEYTRIDRLRRLSPEPPTAESLFEHFVDVVNLAIAFQLATHLGNLLVEDPENPGPDV